MEQLPTGLVFGTSGLAAAYAGYPAPSFTAATKVVHAALDLGLMAFDTAPGYGLAEAWLGRLVQRPDVFIATKLVDGSPADLHCSLDQSRRNLRRWSLDLVQLHNATERQLAGSRALDVLRQAKAAGQVRWIGASVYTATEVGAAVAAGLDQVQVPYNLLDRRCHDAAVAAARAGVAVWVRSVWLRGALTPVAHDVPVVTLNYVDDLRDRLLVAAPNLPAVALQFVLAQPWATAAVVGLRTRPDVVAAVAAAAGRLSWWRRWLARRDPQLPDWAIDPRYWDVPEGAA